MRALALATLFAASVALAGPPAGEPRARCAACSLLPAGATGSDLTLTGNVTAQRFFSSLTGSTAVVFGTSAALGISFSTGAGDIQFFSSSAEQWRVDGTTGNLVSSPGRSVNTGGTYISTAASGSNAVTVSNGARIGTGSSGYISFDGSNNLNVVGPGIYAANANAQYFAQMGSSTSYFASEGIANVTTADVTSSGASNLISYTLPANALTATNRCVRITGWGTALNNANAKTVALDFGSQTVISKILTPSIASTTWKVQAIVCRSGASTQDIYAEAWNPMGTTVSSVDANTVLYQAARTAGTQTETATIVIKGKTTTATTTDVTMDGLTVEFM